MTLTGRSVLNTALVPHSGAGLTFGYDIPFDDNPESDRVQRQMALARDCTGMQPAAVSFWRPIAWRMHLNTGGAETPLVVTILNELFLDVDAVVADGAAPSSLTSATSIREELVAECRRSSTGSTGCRPETESPTTSTVSISGRSPLTRRSQISPSPSRSTCCSHVRPRIDGTYQPRLTASVVSADSGDPVRVLDAQLMAIGEGASGSGLALASATMPSRCPPWCSPGTPWRSEAASGRRRPMPRASRVPIRADRTPDSLRVRLVRPSVTGGPPGVSGCRLRSRDSRSRDPRRVG